MFESKDYKAHVFICTECQFLDENNRPCDEKTAAEFRKLVKKLAKEKWSGDEVRVNASGCLSRCEKGITCVVYPKTKWLEKLRPGDEQRVLQAIQEQINSN